MKRRMMKLMLSLLLCTALVCGLSATALATPSDYGVSVTFDKSYNEDGKLKVRYQINTGMFPGSSNPQTELWAEVYNAAGKRIFNWSAETLEANTKITRNYAANWSKLPSGKYTFKVYVKVSGSVFSGISYMRDSTSWYWTKTINHSAPVRISFKENPHILTDDGVYKTKFIFEQSGCKDKVAYLEVYDEWGNFVWKTNSKPLTKETGTLSIVWNGFPSSGGTRCADGNYILKYWVTGGDPKQATTSVTMF